MKTSVSPKRITETDMRVARFLSRGGRDLFDREICQALKIDRSTFICSMKRLVEAEVLAASPAKRGCVPVKRVFTINEKSPTWSYIKFLYSEEVL